MKRRLDQILVERGLAASREQARRLIMAGEILLDGHPATKPGKNVPDDCRLQVLSRPRYVRRGGEKLAAALSHFKVPVAGRVCLDVGASTGGFTDCLLQHGARRVYALDVGHGQLDWRLRNDPRVVVMEGVNARYLRKSDLPETPGAAVVDVSFISLTMILAPVTGVLAGGAWIITLVKPQFEAGRSQVARGGVVRDEEVRRKTVVKVREYGTSLGLEWLGVIPSPLRGPAGNVEYLAAWKKT